MNSETTLKAIELAHTILQNNLVDESGKLALDDKFLKNLDEILEKFSETRTLVEAMR